MEDAIRRALDLVRKAARDDYLGYVKLGDEKINNAVRDLTDTLIQEIHQEIQFILFQQRMNR